MILRIKVEGYINLDVPGSVSGDEDTKQAWINEFTTWVKDTQEEFTLPMYDDVETWIEDIDFLVTE